MKYNENPVIPGPPCPGKAPENMALGSAPAEFIPSQPVEQKLPHAALEKKSSKQRIKTEVAVPVKDFKEFKVHPYEVFVIKKQTYSFHGKIKNYEGPLEE